MKSEYTEFFEEIKPRRAPARVRVILSPRFCFIPEGRPIVLPGSEIMIYDVPKLAVEERIDWDDRIGTFEVVEKEDPHAALRAEKEALLARLAEINRLLGE